MDSHQNNCCQRIKGMEISLISFRELLFDVRFPHWLESEEGSDAHRRHGEALGNHSAPHEHLCLVRLSSNEGSEACCEECRGRQGTQGYQRLFAPLPQTLLEEGFLRRSLGLCNRRRNTHGVVGRRHGSIIRRVSDEFVVREIRIHLSRLSRRRRE